MAIIGVIFLVIGFITVCVGGVIILIAAFKENILWGLGMIFFSIVGLIFVVTHWEEAKLGFLIQLAGIPLCFLGLMVTFGAVADNVAGEEEAGPGIVAEKMQQENQKEDGAPVAAEGAGEDAVEGNAPGANGDVFPLAGAPNTPANPFEGATPEAVPGRPGMPGGMTDPNAAADAGSVPGAPGNEGMPDGMPDEPGMPPGTFGESSLPSAVQDEIKEAMDGYTKWFSTTFAVDVRSEEVNTILEKTIAAKTQALMGNPLRLSIHHFQIVARPSGAKVTVKLAESSAQMEDQANLMFEQAGMGKVVETVSFGAMKAALKILHKMDRQSNVKILGNNEKTVDIMATGGLGSFQGKELTKIAFRIEKQQNVVSRTKLFLDDGTSVQVRFKHTRKEHGGTSFPVLTASKFSIKGPGINHGGAPLPHLVVFKYENYRFK